MVYLLFACLLAVLTACADAPAPNVDGQPNAAQGVPTSTPFPTAQAVARETFIVERGDVVRTLEFTGRWEPRDRVTLGFEVAGAVRAVNVQRDATVNAGQLLADLQIDALERDLASANISLQDAIAESQRGRQTDVRSVEDAQIDLVNAELALQRAQENTPWTGVAQARLTLDDAERDLEDARRAYAEALSQPESPGAGGAVDAARAGLLDAEDRLRNAQISYFSSAQQYNDYQYTLIEAQNRVTLAQRALQRAIETGGRPSTSAVRTAQLRIDQINEQIAQSSLYSPIDGVVLQVSIRPGDQVQAFQQVITVGLPEPLEVIADGLPLADAQRLSIGLLGVCYPLNQPDLAVQCVVRQIPLTARDVDQTTRVGAIFDELPRGTIIQVEMPLETAEGVLRVPPRFVREFQGVPYVLLQTPEGPRRVNVTVGLRTDDWIELQAGVSEGDVVIGP
ncbi:MAG: hypothetical protein SF029_21825 [bacterium]|nr:hypothetical protein [bacterium]